MILPTAYWGPLSYYQLALQGPFVIETQESFEKQTFRNRCILNLPIGGQLRLSVPVMKVEHRQLTQDIRISYQQHWQHQHWMALVSAYKHTPYFFYYEDFIRPIYQRKWVFLIDLNDAICDIVLHLLRNLPPSGILSDEQQMNLPKTTSWSGQLWTDSHPWQTEPGILSFLFEKGPDCLLPLP